MIALGVFKDDSTADILGQFFDLPLGYTEEEIEYCRQHSHYPERWKEMQESSLRRANELALILTQWGDIEIELAYYDYEDYEGNAFVLFRKGDQLFEVNAGHCSCYGLEGQWDPEPTTYFALAHRIKNGTLGKSYKDKNTFADELTGLILSKAPHLDVIFAG